eukprot:COSAG01_NODE_54_length_31327_cov_317.045356_10_plen_211_part_00
MSLLRDRLIPAVGTTPTIIYSPFMEGTSGVKKTKEGNSLLWGCLLVGAPFGPRGSVAWVPVLGLSAVVGSCLLRTYHTSTTRIYFACNGTRHIIYGAVLQEVDIAPKLGDRDGKLDGVVGGIVYRRSETELLIDWCGFPRFPLVRHAEVVAEARAYCIAQTVRGTKSDARCRRGGLDCATRPYRHSAGLAQRMVGRHDVAIQRLRDCVCE